MNRSVYGGHKSETRRTVTLKILGGDDVLELPCTTQTTVGEVKEIVAGQACVDADEILFFYKAGAYTTRQKDIDQIQPVTLVKGIRSFKAQKHQWPHPIGIIGTGYHGLKTAMTFMLDGNDNIVCFDRNNKVGGYCWITGANKTSRLQTEFGSFHCWWGPDIAADGRMSYPDCNTDNGWHIWPYKEEILRHFNHAADVFGIKPHIHFETHVSQMDIVGGLNDSNRYYKLTCEDVSANGGNKVTESHVSALYTYPGSLTRNRIIDYPGEDLFDGDIRYGMNDDTPYDKLPGATVAILGNGAFAVENARTAIECGGKKAYIVTRRKNLASPRLPCWFVHQGPVPTPGPMILKMFEPMYELVGFGDPWQFHSVHSNADRTNVTILQSSRFGIGDVTFLMVHWGLLEFVVSTLKRCSRNTLHLENGQRLENVTVILKSLGLLGDWSVDKLHNMKEMVGMYCSGDFRRPLMIDATGMNAANFTTFSTGIGTTDFALRTKFFLDYPREWVKLEAAGIMKALPRHKEEPNIDKPAYVTDVKFSMTGGFIIEGMLPKIAELTMNFSRYKHTMYHKSHNTKRTLEVAVSEWDTYQKEWKSRGIDHEYVPYPYTKEIIESWFSLYTQLTKVPISIDGPSAENMPLNFIPGENAAVVRALANASASERRP